MVISEQEKNRILKLHRLEEQTGSAIQSVFSPTIHEWDVDMYGNKVLEVGDTKIFNSNSKAPGEWWHVKEIEDIDFDKREYPKTPFAGQPDHRRRFREKEDEKRRKWEGKKIGVYYCPSLKCDYGGRMKNLDNYFLTGAYRTWDEAYDYLEWKLGMDLDEFRR